MAIKWTELDATRCLRDLTNPFEKAGVGTQITKKPRLEDVINGLRASGSPIVSQETKP